MKVGNNSSRPYAYLTEGVTEKFENKCLTLEYCFIGSYVESRYSTMLSDIDQKCIFRPIATEQILDRRHILASARHLRMVRSGPTSRELSFRLTSWRTTRPIQRL